MTLQKIKLQQHLNGNEYRFKMWKYEQPSMRFYYRFNNINRTRKKRKIKEIHHRLKGQVRKNNENLIQKIPRIKNKIR